MASFGFSLLDFLERVHRVLNPALYDGELFGWLFAADFFRQLLRVHHNALALIVDLQPARGAGRADFELFGVPQRLQRIRVRF